MSFQSIPLAPLPSQSVAVALGEQQCRIDIVQRQTGLFLDLYVNDAAIVLGVLCLDANFLVADQYVGFSGDLIFVDLQGSDDPDYTGLGGRYALYWYLP